MSDDYEALARDLRKRHLRHPTGGVNLFSRAADAVEALRAENAAYLKGFNGSEMLRRAVEAERDALQARLDAMTVETCHHIRAGERALVETRMVSPWTAVEEGI